MPARRPPPSAAAPRHLRESPPLPARVGTSPARELGVVTRWWVLPARALRRTARPRSRADSGPRCTPTRRDRGLGHARQLGLPLALPARLPPRRRRHAAHRHRRPRGQRRGRPGDGSRVCRRGRRARRLPGADAHRLLDRGHPPAGHPARRGRGRAGRGRRGVGGPAAGARRRPARPRPQPDPQRRRGRAPRAAARRRAQVVPADLPGVLRAPPDRAGRRPARHDPPGRRRGAVRAGPALRRRGRARVRPARRDLRGHVGAGAAERDGGAGRGDGAGEPVGQPDHHRAGGVARACWRGRRRPAAWRRTSTRRPARASRPPTSPGTARR